MHAAGQGTDQNYEEAVRWFLLAAENGDPSSHTLLGNFYFNGIGVELDKVEALKWYKIAANEQQISAQQLVDNLTAELSESEVLRGESLASQWLEQH